MQVVNRYADSSVRLLALTCLKHEEPVMFFRDPQRGAGATSLSSIAHFHSVDWIGVGQWSVSGWREQTVDFRAHRPGFLRIECDGAKRGRQEQDLQRHEHRMPSRIRVTLILPNLYGVAQKGLFWVSRMCADNSELAGYASRQLSQQYAKFSEPRTNLGKAQGALNIYRKGKKSRP